MLSKRLHFFLGMMQGLGQQKSMLVFRFRADEDFFNLGTFLMGDTYYIFKELMIEAFRSRNVLHIIHLVDLTDNSIQWYIISLVWFSVCLAKNKPTTIILL